MTHCVGCGVVRDPGTRFCRGCGRPFEGEGGPPAATAGGRESSAVGGHGPAWYAGLAGGVTVLVVAVVVGGMALAGAGDREPPDGGGIPSLTPLASATITTTSPRTVLPSRSANTRPTPSPTPTPLGNDVVEVSADAAGHRSAAEVVDVVTTYFVGINARDFPTWISLFTSAMKADFNLDQVAVGFRSTHDSEVRLVSVADSPDGRVAAAVEFVSTQDAVDGPDGLTCTRWATVLFLQLEQGRFAIGRPPPEYRASYQPC